MSNIGPEQKNNEYKVFMFNPLKISNQDALEYLKNSKFVFNNSVIETIKNYIDIYLPKYICSYVNPKTELDEGYLFFGVSNNGDIVGIPYQGMCIPVDFIEEQINKIFLDYLRFPDDTIRDDVRTFVSVQIIPVDKSHFITGKTKLIYKNNQMYQNYIQELKQTTNFYEVYSKKRRIWNEMFDTNNLKLCEMINDPKTRKMIWSYIKETTRYSKKYFVNKYSHLEKYCDVDNYWNLMTKINTQYEFKPLKPKAIFSVKNDPINIYYWITKWKDSKMATLKKVKPKSPKKSIDSNYPIFLLSQVTKMNPYWIIHNPDLNLFVIKITIEIKNKYVIEFQDPENKWKKIYRTFEYGEPMSKTYI